MHLFQIKLNFNLSCYLDLQLDSLSYEQMGPAEAVIRSNSGAKMYLVIKYKRGGEWLSLKVPLHYSAYYERPFIYIKHPYGTYYYGPIILIVRFFRRVFKLMLTLFLDRFYLTGYFRYRLGAMTVNICRENSLAAVCVQRHLCRITTCKERPRNWFTCPELWANERYVSIES